MQVKQKNDGIKCIAVGEKHPKKKLTLIFSANSDQWLRGTLLYTRNDLHVLLYYHEYKLQGLWSFCLLLRFQYKPLPVHWQKSISGWLPSNLPRKASPLVHANMEAIGLVEVGLPAW